MSPIIGAQQIEHRKKILPVSVTLGLLMRAQILGLAISGWLLTGWPALAFALTNGIHDASNAIATLVATRAARPKSAILLAAACPVAKASANPLAQDFIKMLISAPVQTSFAKEMGNGPVNTKVDVNMPELRMAPVGARAKLVIQPDWDTINAQREDWTKRWNREVER